MDIVAENELLGAKVELVGKQRDFDDSNPI